MIKLHNQINLVRKEIQNRILRYPDYPVRSDHLSTDSQKTLERIGYFLPLWVRGKKSGKVLMHILNRNYKFCKCGEGLLFQGALHCFQCVYHNKNLRLENRKARVSFSIEQQTGIRGLTNISQRPDVSQKLKMAWDSLTEKERKDRGSRIQKTIRKKYKGKHHLNEGMPGQEKYKRSCKEKYGVDNPKQLARVKKDFSRKWKKKSTQEVERIVNARRDTNLRIRGVEHAMKDPNIVEAARQTYEDRTGYRTPSSNPEVRAKFKKTMLSRHGVESPFQMEKSKNNSMRAAYRFKEIRYGKHTWFVQGYEDLALGFLLKTFRARNIITGHGFTVKLEDGSIYYPDFFLRGTDFCVEVKCNYTLFGKDHLKTSKLNAEAVKSSGMKHILLMVEPHKKGTFKIRRVPDEWISKSETWIRRTVNKLDREDKFVTVARIPNAPGKILDPF